MFCVHCNVHTLLSVSERVYMYAQDEVVMVVEGSVQEEGSVMEMSVVVEEDVVVEYVSVYLAVIADSEQSNFTCWDVQVLVTSIEYIVIY